MTILDPGVMGLATSLHGQIDSVTPHVVRGWAYDPTSPAKPVELVVTDRGEELGIVVADAYREDLEREGVGTGHHAFECWLPTRLSPFERHIVRVFRRIDGRELFLSPVIIERSEAFGASFQARIRELVRAPADVADVEARIEFFLTMVDELKQHHADSVSHREIRERERARSRTHAQGRALIIDTTLPDETRDAGSNAILSHAHSLRRLGYDVTFLPSDLGNLAKAQADELEGEGLRVIRAPLCGSVEELLRRQRDMFDLVYIHRLENALRYMPLVQAEQPSAHIVYSIADLHHLRLGRQSRIAGDRTLAEAAEIARIRELQSAWTASAVITHSTHEAEILRAALPTLRLHVVPWAVCLDPIVRSFELRRHVGFIGGFRHAPNVDAVERLVERIMPIVLRTHPHIKLVIVGSDMPDVVRRLAQPGVIIMGHAPDLFLVLNRLRLTVAPLSFGAGVKGKVLESFARGLPCVMTPIAAEGLELAPPLDALVVEDDDAIAKAIVELHEDAALNRAAVEAGYKCLEANWNEQTVDAAMAIACGVKRDGSGTVAAAT